MPPKRRTPTETATDRVTYRELRNTPGRVWERLRADDPLTLVAEGEAKALLIPVHDGDVAGAYAAYLRGRSLVAQERLQANARVRGADQLTLAEINDEIRAARASRRGSKRASERASLRVSARAKARGR